MLVTLIHLSFASLALQSISPTPIRHFVEFEIDRNGVRQKQEGEEEEEEEEEGEVCGRSDHDGRVSAYGALQYGERVSGWDVD